jgi:hypothetical protein
MKINKSYINFLKKNLKNTSIIYNGTEIKMGRQGCLHCQVLICKRHLLTKKKRYISKKQTRRLLPSYLYSFIRVLNLEYM